MTKLFLFLIMLSSVISSIFGMEDDKEMQEVTACEIREVGLGEAALNAIADHLNAGNSHLVRSIAREWHEQNPNGTYRDFVNKYNCTLPVGLMRAVWIEADLLKVVELGLRYWTSAVIRMTKGITHEWEMEDFRRGFETFSILKPGYEKLDIFDYHRIRPNGGRDSFCRGHDLAQSLARFETDMQRLSAVFENRIRDFFQYLFFGKRIPPCWQCRICLPVQPSPEFYDKMNIIFNHEQNLVLPRGYCAITELMSKRANITISDFIVACQNIIAVIPSIVIPDDASDKDRNRIVKETIDRAIDTQTRNLHTIEEAVQYLENLRL